MANKGKCIVCQSKAESVKVKKSIQKEKKFALRYEICEERRKLHRA